MEYIMLARHLIFALGLLSAALPAQAGRLVDMDIVNRTTGETLELHHFRGEPYIAGNPGDGYAVRLVNHTDQRVLVVLSVDGVNVVSGETAAPGQSGYVLGPWERTEITGWRKSLQEVAQFYFTALPDSYAARTDRPDNVGVIGAAVFREKVLPPPTPVLSLPAPAAPEARSGATADAAEAQSSARAGTAMAKKAERLGTGHGQREYAPIRYTDFVRASASPNEVLSVRYDSRPNLLARGVIVKPRPVRPYWPEPQPFPGAFVPDPSS
jgi:hypothetical protein